MPSQTPKTRCLTREQAAHIDPGLVALEALQTLLLQAHHVVAELTAVAKVDPSTGVNANTSGAGHSQEPSQPDESLVASVNQTWKILGISRGSVYKLMKDKKLHFITIAGRRKVLKTEIARLLGGTPDAA